MSAAAALLLALLVAAHALLLARELFPHAGWPVDVAAGDLLATAAVAAGVWAARRAGVGSLPAALALALLIPFAADLVLAPLPWLTDSGSARRVVFVALVVGAELLLVRATPCPNWLARWAGRAALLAVALALAFGAAELAVARAGLGARKWARPLLIVPGDERRVPLSEIALFRPFDAPAAAQGLSARFRPYVFLKGWYDRPRWDYFDAGGNVDYVCNRYGLRDHDFELAKAEGELRIVAIGDSFTFGVGVQLEDCWTEVLERGLRERRDGPVEVINAGFAAGYEPPDYEEWIRLDAPRLQPDVLIVGLCLNDMHPEVSLYAWKPPRKVVQPLGGRSRLLNALQSAWSSDPPVPRELIDWSRLLRREPDTWEGAKAALRRIHAQLEERGVRMLIVPFPMLSGLREEYPYAGLLAMVAEFCDEEGIEHVDLLPRFLGLVDEDLWAHPTDQHPNDVGHRIIGEGVLEALTRD